MTGAESRNAKRAASSRWKPRKRPAQIVAPERETPSGHGERVLLVDDERSLASVGERRLTALGYAVTVSTDPVTAPMAMATSAIEVRDRAPRAT